MTTPPLPIFSVAHPTLGRPNLAIQRCEEWFSKSSGSNNIEYVFGVHNFDTKENIEALRAFATKCGGKVRISVTSQRGSAPNWNQAALATRGSLIIQAQDDLAPPQGWDNILAERLSGLVGNDWQKKPIFLAVSDGHREDRLCITSIMTRAYLATRGYFLFPGYEGVYADDDSTAQAYKDAKARKITFIEARDIIFEHQHYTFEGGMAFDQTYAIENASASYQKGLLLFAKRHPEWHAGQLCRLPPLQKSGLIHDFSKL